MESPPKGQIAAYIRVSSVDQNSARQQEAIRNYVDDPQLEIRWFEDKVSGKNRRDRTELTNLLKWIRDGDVVLVKSPDRLARSTVDLLGIIKDIQDKGAQIRFIDNPSLNTDSPQGTFMLTILGAVAELERATIRERQREGIALARAAGKYQHRQKLSEEDQLTVKQLDLQGVPKTKIAQQMKCSRQTIYHVLNQTGSYAD